MYEPSPPMVIASETPLLRVSSYLALQRRKLTQYRIARPAYPVLIRLVSLSFRDRVLRYMSTINLGNSHTVELTVHAVRRQCYFYIS